MALQYGFFDSVLNNGSYDRECGAAFFTALLKATFKNGITPGSFMASAGSGLTVNLTAGSGFVDGVFFYDDSASTVTCTSASGTRTDLIVAKLNAAARTVTLEVKAGTTTAASGEVAIATATVTGSASPRFWRRSGRLLPQFCKGAPIWERRSGNGSRSWGRTSGMPSRRGLRGWIPTPRDS